MKLEITISSSWRSAVVKVGSCVKEYMLPGGFKKYRLIRGLRELNYLGSETLRFTGDHVGLSALYAFVTNCPEC